MVCDDDHEHEKDRGIQGLDGRDEVLDLLPAPLGGLPACTGGLISWMISLAGKAPTMAARPTRLASRASPTAGSRQRQPLQRLCQDALWRSGTGSFHDCLGYEHSGDGGIESSSN